MSPVRKPSSRTSTARSMSAASSFARRIAQAHRKGGCARDRIGETLSAMSGAEPHRFMRPAGVRSVVLRAQRCRGQHAERTRGLGRLVQSTSPNDYPSRSSNCRPAHQLHGAIVGQDVREFDIGTRREASHPSAKHARMHDVGFRPLCLERSRAIEKATRVMR